MRKRGVATDEVRRRIEATAFIAFGVVFLLFGAIAIGLFTNGVLQVFAAAAR